VFKTTEFDVVPKDAPKRLKTFIVKVYPWLKTYGPVTSIVPSTSVVV
jgi:hypothetical protein